MLDVSRHFFAVEDVKRYIDYLAYYKVNRFHIHLSDDQGWRIEIKSWPKLAEIGGSTQVGGGPGGFYTQERYAEIVRYAQSRYMVVVPEIDMPGHTMAALASYPELSREGIMPSLYTGMDVGVSSLNTRSEFTYQFVDDVIRELAEITPGPYLHIGGDEAYKTSAPDYSAFIERVQSIIDRHGKIMVGWEEIAGRTFCQTRLRSSGPSTPTSGRWRGGPWSKARDYHVARVEDIPGHEIRHGKPPRTVLGGVRRGADELRVGPPADQPGVGRGKHHRRRSAPLVRDAQTLDDVEYLAFPRLPGINEIGWSAAAGRSWDDYRDRLASHGPRFELMGIDYYRSPQVVWASNPASVH